MGKGSGAAVVPDGHNGLPSRTLPSTHPTISVGAGDGRELVMKVQLCFGLDSIPRAQRPRRRLYLVPVARTRPTSRNATRRALHHAL